MYFLLALYATLAIGVSFFCSIAEAVVLSITPAYIAELESKGRRSAVYLKRLKSNIDRPLAAILSLNTIAHTAGAAGVGATSAKIWGSESLGWASAAMTLAILILSEIIPKTIGALHWRTLAPLVGRVTLVLIWAVYPLVVVSEQLTRLFSKNKRHGIVTRDEVVAMASLSAQGGQIGNHESKILQNLLCLKEIRVSEIMTPRTVMISLPEDMSVTEVFNEHPNLSFSRLPVYRETIDQITGFVLRSELLQKHASPTESKRKIKAFKRPLNTVLAGAPTLELLIRMLNQKEHLSLVIDTYGGVLGVISLEDVLESLLGTEIVDETDKVEDMQKLARQKWKQRRKSIENA